MSRWTAKYDDEQRTAIERAYCELRIRPVAKIARMAAAGELRSDASSEPLPAFEIPYSSVMSIGQAAERRKAGKRLPADLANLPARDRAKTLQLRLAGIIDNELAHMERQQAKQGRKALDWEQIRRATRALRELGTLPDPSDMRLPRTPGQRDAGGAKPDNATRDSLAGKLLAASDASVSPSTRAETSRTSPTTQDTESEHSAQHASDANDASDIEPQHDSAHNDDDSDAPCSDERARVSGLAASGVLVSAAG